MSWSVRFIGTPDNVVAAIDKESARLTGQSKEEFDGVREALVLLVRNNVGTSVDLEASGHASFGASIAGEPGGKIYGNCTVRVTPVHGSVLV